MTPIPAENTTVMSDLTLRKRRHREAAALPTLHSSATPNTEGYSYVYPTDAGENDLAELNCKPARLVLEDGTEFEG